MNDLEDRLRDMLQERARDVTTFPARLADPAHLDSDGELPEQPRHLRWWLVAATVVAVLAVAAGAIAIGRSHHTSSPPVATHTPTTTPTTPTTPPPTSATVTKAPHVERLLDPRRVALTVPTGYRVVAWSSRTSYNQVSLRPSGETGTAGNGGTPATAFVTVFAKGRFDGNDPSWKQTTFNRATAYLGKAKLPGGSNKISTLVFVSAAGRTVLVQGDTSRTSTEQALRRLAATVRPDAHDTDAPGSGYPVPFRLTAMTAGLALVWIEDERSSGYPLIVQLENGTVGVELQVKAGTGFDGLDPGATKRTVAGRPAMVDPKQGKAVVRITDTVVLEISAHTSRGTVATPALAIAAQILAGVRPDDTDLDTAIP